MNDGSVSNQYTACLHTLGLLCDRLSAQRMPLYSFMPAPAWVLELMPDLEICTVEEALCLGLQWIRGSLAQGVVPEAGCLCRDIDTWLKQWKRVPLRADAAHDDELLRQLTAIVGALPETILHQASARVVH